MENVCENQGELGGSGGGLGFDGGMAPLMLVPHARWLVPLGDLDPVAAAPLSDAALTPYHAIKRALPALGPGTTAVVIGAGGLGQMAVQLLKCLSPASLIVVDQRAGALESARQLGRTTPFCRATRRLQRFVSSRPVAAPRRCSTSSVSSRHSRSLRRWCVRSGT
jgi:propanol-preferring alcohol dehydrogenase